MLFKRRALLRRGGDGVMSYVTTRLDAKPVHRLNQAGTQLQLSSYAVLTKLTLCQIPVYKDALNVLTLASLIPFNMAMYVL